MTEKKPPRFDVGSEDQQPKLSVWASPPFSDLALALVAAIVKELDRAVYDIAWLEAAVGTPASLPEVVDRIWPGVVDELRQCLVVASSPRLVLVSSPDWHAGNREFRGYVAALGDRDRFIVDPQTVRVLRELEKTGIDLRRALGNASK